MLTFATTKGNPNAIPTGAAPTFAADLTDISNHFAAGRTYRKVATQAALASATGMVDNDLAVVDNIDGAHWKYDGAAGQWIMLGVARFATVAARAAAITTPVQGMLSQRVDNVSDIEQYFGAYNVSTNPNGANPAGWYPLTRNGPLLVQEYVKPTDSAWTATTTQTGVLLTTFVLPYLGRYRARWVIANGSSAAMAGGVVFVVDVVGGASGLVNIGLGHDIASARSVMSYEKIFNHTDAAHMTVQLRADANYIGAGTKTYYANSTLQVEYLGPNRL